MPRSYPPEFRGKVLDLLKGGRTVAQGAHDLQISDQTIYTWRRQALVDAGQEPGLTSVEKAGPASARRRIVELETCDAEGPLAPAQDDVLPVTVSADASLIGTTVEITAVISGDFPESDTRNNTATTAFEVVGAQPSPPAPTPTATSTPTPTPTTNQKPRSSAWQQPERLYWRCSFAPVC
ncbi:MAG: transposase [Actinophytocola sp.]|uniref:transposase n=1 Tax=Actinophytocola sp. TaxID=1872138 RepID=UPI003C751781